MSCHLRVTAGKDIHKKLQYEDPLEKGAQYVGPLLTALMPSVCSCTVHLKCPLLGSKAVNADVSSCRTAGTPSELEDCAVQ